MAKYFWDLPIIIIMNTKPTTVESIPTNAIIQLVINIIRRLPKNIVIAPTRLAKLWFMVCPMVSTSLVILESMSPMLVLSKYDSGSLFIFFDMSLLRLLDVF